MTLTTLTRTLRSLRRATRILTYQEALIESQRALIKNLEEQNDQLVLEHGREMLGLISGWLIHCERPEVDMRDELAEFADRLSGQIARLEEHIV